MEDVSIDVWMAGCMDGWYTDKASSSWIGGLGGGGVTHLVSLGFAWTHLDSRGFTWTHLNSLGLT